MIQTESSAIHLVVNELCLSYKSQKVLNNVNFHINKGELVSILGPNGVGKTTLLRCINALLTPQNGSVLLEGRDIMQMVSQEIARNIAYVPQQTVPYRVTVFDAVLLGRKPYVKWKTTQQDLKMVDSVLSSLNMNSLSMRYIDELSGGELQKVSIARALVQEPQLLLLDEPTSSLDMKNQIAIMSLIRHVVDSHGFSAIMTMHDLNTALRYSDKAIFVKDGYIYAASSVTDISSEVIEEVYGISVSMHTINEYPVIVPKN